LQESDIVHFSFHPPPPALGPWVKTIWCARGTREEFAAPEPIVPDGCVEIVFNFADPFADDRGAQPLDLIAGQMTGPVTTVATGTVDLIGVRFWPGRAGAALRTPMWELRDRLVDASSILTGAATLVESLRELPDDARLDHLSTELSRRFSAGRPRHLDAVDHALRLIETHRGRVAIDRVARRVGITRRHLERRFKDEVGLGAKHLARIIRVHAALQLMGRDPLLSGAELSAQCGYSDQAHLIRECKALTGRTPARLMTAERSLAGLMREGGGGRSA
jgi:AraC-like DNA-binding protein